MSQVENPMKIAEDTVRRAERLYRESEDLLKIVMRMRDEIVRLRVAVPRVDERADRQHDGHVLDRAARAVEALNNEESCEHTHIGQSHFFTRAMALKEAAEAIRALKPKED